MISTDVNKELNWLENVFEIRLKEKAGTQTKALPKPPKASGKSQYAVFLNSLKLDEQDRLLLILTLCPMLKPKFLDEVIQRHIGTDGDHPDLGGFRAQVHRGILPTGETAMFLLAGTNMELRLKSWQWLRQKSTLITKQYVEISLPKTQQEPVQTGVLYIPPRVLEEVIFGASMAPAFSMEFPAKRIETTQNWSDLTLPSETVSQLTELKEWIENHNKMADWGISKKIKNGYRALFYGPPGTGKTLAATLLGKYTNTEVFLVDLSMVVSKYIGETEKNLAKLFKEAHNQNWILFFDEADALFGKRTSVRDAHDKYANQEVSYLLQRIEEFSGLVILASNLKGNIDEAFLRRFQSVIYFPVPGPKERAQIWQTVFENVPKPPAKKELQNLASKYELTGSNILNAAHYACLRAVVENKNIAIKDVVYGIEREILKEGKVI